MGIISETKELKLILLIMYPSMRQLMIIKYMIKKIWKIIKEF